MALPIQALFTLVDLKQELHLSVAANADIDSRMEGVIGRASQICEDFCHHRLVYRQVPFIEYHTVKEPRSVIYLMERPIVSISEVKEDANLNWTDATALTANRDYIASMLDGKITRTSGAIPIDWFFVGVRTIRVTYVAGYEPIPTSQGGAAATPTNCPAIPDSLKGVALALAVLMWREIERKQQGIQTLSDGAGSSTRFAVASLSDWMKDALQPYVYECIYPTGERDA